MAPTESGRVNRPAAPFQLAVEKSNEPLINAAYIAKVQRCRALRAEIVMVDLLPG